MVNVPFVPKDSTGVHRFRDRDYRGFKGPQRNLILWQCPHIGNNRYIEMYINPQGLTTSNRKTITSKRTKGGFLNQYWGEELEVVNISGITGDGGVEALYALFDVYRSEQLAMTEIVTRAFAGSEENLVKRRQPLGPLSTSVVMWYMGEGKRGYFTDMQYDENVQQNGTFTYRITFTVVETINRRRNFMPWHRKPWSTSENPNISSNGRLLVTGGYPGDNETRIGPLNSPVGSEQFVNETDPETGDTTTVRRWVQSPMFDPKYWQDKDIVNPLLFPNQAPESTLAPTTGLEDDATTPEGQAAQAGTRTSADRETLAESAEEAADVSSGNTSVQTGVPSGLSSEDEESESAVEERVNNDTTIVTTDVNAEPTLTETELFEALEQLPPEEQDAANQQVAELRREDSQLQDRQQRLFNEQFQEGLSEEREKEIQSEIESINQERSQLQLQQEQIALDGPTDTFGTTGTNNPSVSSIPGGNPTITTATAGGGSTAPTVTSSVDTRARQTDAAADTGTGDLISNPLPTSPAPGTPRAVPDGTATNVSAGGSQVDLSASSPATVDQSQRDQLAITTQDSDTEPGSILGPASGGTSRTANTSSPGTVVDSGPSTQEQIEVVQNQEASLSSEASRLDREASSLESQIADFEGNVEDREYQQLEQRYEENQRRQQAINQRLVDARQELQALRLEAGN